ncbi:hypothetical protein BO85DRAFT_67862 [Aspergillus piperis CBS 112811]|uniref:Uncharacterized protein n=1 Tax=Aspergillus piperis CBS 112811 TaxID=1448313 RepID=A0A8G1QY52_9EURO|nr:hypothetical protein BO85DRAFT_67862 [Aspergillus piperis CBS 112811]RAH55854.1 hypothetical protein BO85DRAFT_67862 [Aspergillus piperis CBS 112811]
MNFESLAMTRSEATGCNARKLRYTRRELSRDETSQRMEPKQRRKIAGNNKLEDKARQPQGREQRHYFSAFRGWLDLVASKLKADLVSPFLFPARILRGHVEDNAYRSFTLYRVTNFVAYFSLQCFFSL